MRWPWVSRLAFDLAVERYEKAEERAQKLQDHVTRVTRKELGMTEEPRTAPRVTETELEIPDEVEMLIREYDSEQTRVRLRAEARASRMHGTPWSEIQKVLDPEAGVVTA